MIHSLEIKILKKLKLTGTCIKHEFGKTNFNGDEKGKCKEKENGDWKQKYQN